LFCGVFSLFLHCFVVFFIILTLFCSVFLFIPTLCCHVFLYSYIVLWCFCFHSYTTMYAVIFYFILTLFCGVFLYWWTTSTLYSCSVNTISCYITK
jgi:hypothetical protein